MASSMFIKTANPTPLAGVTPDPKYKIVGGGAQLPAGSAHRLVVLHPSLPPALLVLLSPRQLFSSGSELVTALAEYNSVELLLYQLNERVIAPAEAKAIEQRKK